MNNISNPVLSVRVNPVERAVLEEAASHAGTSVSDFVRRKALEAAEIDVLSRTILTIPAADWERFEGWVHRPAERIPGLESLVRRSPSWER